MIFVIEDNSWAISVPKEKSTAVSKNSERAAGYGIPGVSVDGQDVFAVYEVAKEAIERARNGEGPTLIEAKTYRFRGHFEGDPQIYRSKEEVEWWKKNKDPIVLFEKTVLEKGLLTKEELDTIRERVKREIEESIKFAEESPWPKPEEVLEDVFSTPTKGVLVWQW
nr:thiamine pyrophosphate-dependent enzyme [Thermococcus sp. 2319x1]